MEPNQRRSSLANTQLTGNEEMSPTNPINDEKNNAMFAKYQEEATKNDKVIFCGRLADYKYYDMHVVIERALEVVANEFDWKKQWFMKYFLKEEFLKDSGARNAGNKARNDVEEIVKREGYQPCC